MMDTQVRALLDTGALTGEWVLDPAKSSIRLRNKVLGFLRVNGVFSDVSGYGVVSPDGEAAGTVAVAAASVKTGNNTRDTHLRSADIFDTVGHPDITFTASSIRLSGQGVAVTGALTVRGRTRPLSFDAAVSVVDDREVGFDAEIQVNRGDYGLGWKGDAIASMISVLMIHAVFTRQ